MTYDWEKKITPRLLDQISALLPKGISLVGLAVRNEKSAEGALVYAVPPSGDVLCLDVSRDIMGDAGSNYGECLRLMKEAARGGVTHE